MYFIEKREAHHRHGWFNDQPRTHAHKLTPHTPAPTAHHTRVAEARSVVPIKHQLVLKPTEWDRLTWNDAPAWVQALWASTTAAGTIQIR